MNSPAEDVKDMIELESALGLTFQDNLFVAREPDPPKNCVTIFDTPGESPLTTLYKGEDLFRPSIQVRVRNTSYQDGWDLINSIERLLHCRGPEVWGDSYYSSILCTTPTFHLDWQGNCARFVANFKIQRRQA
jgi:hypothetical protein